MPTTQMPHQLQQLIEQYRTSPPTSARELALFREEVKNAYPRHRLKALQSRSHKQLRFPEFEATNTARAFVADYLRRLETQYGLDVTAGYAELDRDSLPASTIRRVYESASALHRNAAIDFGSHVRAELGRRRKGQSALGTVLENPFASLPDMDIGGATLTSAEAPEPVAPEPVAPEPTPSKSVAAPTARPSKPARKPERRPAAKPVTVSLVALLGLEEPYVSFVAELVKNTKVPERQIFRKAVERDLRATMDRVYRVAAGDYATPALPQRAAPRPRTATRRPPKPSQKATPRATQRAPQTPLAKSDAADSNMPPLHERLRIVVGSDSVGITEAISRLNSRGWLPASGDLRAYISVALSVNSDLERVSRGVYRARLPPPALKLVS